MLQSKKNSTFYMFGYTDRFDLPHYVRVKAAREAQGLPTHTASPVTDPAFWLLKKELYHRNTQQVWQVSQVWECWHRGKVFVAELTNPATGHTAFTIVGHINGGYTAEELVPAVKPQLQAGTSAFLPYTDLELATRH